MNWARKAFLWFGLMAFFIALRQGLLSHLQIFDYWLQENVHLYLKLAILHVEPELIRKAKTRMRKKMGLSSNRDILDYLMKF